MSDEPYRLCDELEKADAEITKLKAQLEHRDKENAWQCALWKIERDKLKAERDRYKKAFEIAEEARDANSATVQDINDPRR